MEQVFVLQHVDRDRVVRLIGVYSSSVLATAALQRLRALPGFSDLPNSFQISGYPMDVDHWTDGCGPL